MAELANETLAEVRAYLKCQLWTRWGDPHHPAEWDGLHYGGGRGSQRYWEYLWAIDQLPHTEAVLDVGSGESGFFPDILNTAFGAVWAIDPALPVYRQSDRWLAESLEQFVQGRPDLLAHFDAVTCISVLEHITDKPAFCRCLDRIPAPIILTFELAFGADLVTMPTLYTCLSEFRRHYLHRIQTCPVWADNSDFGQWRPCGIVLKPLDERFGT